MRKYIVFDAYGTLLSTGTSSIDATRMILRRNNAMHIDAASFYSEWKAERKEYIREMTVFKDEATIFRMTLRRLYGRYRIPGNPDEDVQIMLNTWGRRESFPEVRHTLDCLARDYILCIGSTTDTLPLLRDIERNQIRIDRIYTSQSLQTYKPKKEFYVRILTALKAFPNEILFVGDSLIDDVWGPQQLEIKTCHVNRKQTVYGEIVPDLSVRNLAELQTCIL